MCYHLNAGKSFLSESYDVSTTYSTTLLENESTEVKEYIADINHEDIFINHPLWIKFGPLHVKKFAYVYLGRDEYYPVFGKVVDLLTFSKHPQYAVCIQKSETLYYDSHYNAFVIKLIPSYSVSQLSSLPYFPVIHAHKSYGNSELLFIIIKQFLL